MKRAYRYLSEAVIEIDTNGMLSELWETVYTTRLRKHGDKHKARISACSTVYSECLKEFKKKGIKE